MDLVEYLDIDDDVNVFIVGDIHGDYQGLMEALRSVNFNFMTDMLIGVGDIVDRGNENEKCFNLLKEHWFKTIKGNHEDFCYKGLLDDHHAFYHKMENNGGKWFYELPDDIMEHIAMRLNKLPVLLEVKYRGKKFGFVHADVPVEDWELLKELVSNNDIHPAQERSIIDMCLWSRDVVNKDYVHIAQVDNVFLGHTVLPEIKQVGNCTFLDTGGVFRKHSNEYKFSIVNLKDYC